MSNHVKELFDESIDGLFWDVGTLYNLKSGDVPPDDLENLTKIKKNLVSFFQRYVKNNWRDE